MLSGKRWWWCCGAAGGGADVVIQRIVVVFTHVLFSLFWLTRVLFSIWFTCGLFLRVEGGSISCDGGGGGGSVFLRVCSVIWVVTHFPGSVPWSHLVDRSAI
jgi:hypothetical protein